MQSFSVSVQPVQPSFGITRRSSVIIGEQSVSCSFLYIYRELSRTTSILKDVAVCARALVIRREGWSGFAKDRGKKEKWGKRENLITPSNSLAPQHGDGRRTASENRNQNMWLPDCWEITLPHRKRQGVDSWKWEALFGALWLFSRNFMIHARTWEGALAGKLTRPAFSAK